RALVGAGIQHSSGTLVEGFYTLIDKAARVSANTSVPRTISSGDAYSSGRWLYPFRQGINNMATGAMRAMNRESWYARLTIGRKLNPCLRQDRDRSSIIAGAQSAGASAFNNS